MTRDKLVSVVLCGWLSACQGTPMMPTSPTSVEPPQASPLAAFDGLWQGEFQLTECPGYRNCVGIVGSRQPFSLYLHENSNIVHGTFRATGAVVDVSGPIGADGVITLKGSAPATGSPFDAVGEATVLMIRAQIGASGALVGRIEYDLRPTFNGGRTTALTYRGDIVSATRPGPSLTASFMGKWSGSFLVVGCTVFCLPPHLSEFGSFEMVLKQSGDELSGVLKIGQAALDVRGHVSGAAGSLNTGASTSDTYGAVTRLMSFAFRRSATGRLSGDLVYARDDRGKTIVWQAVLASAGLEALP
jgi:hypothetical protein